VLTVAKVTAGVAGIYADYLEGKAQAPELGDYYLKDGERVEAPGRWAGGAWIVGGDPGRAVSGDQLRALMAVRRPDTGELLRRVGGSGEAVAAIDATFSVPKSVSAVWALAGPQLRAEIERAHERAVDQALGYAVGHVAMVRERVDASTVIHSRAADVIATSWRHTTARAVDGRPADPQLHSHVLLHAAVRRDGRVVAIDSRSWLVHRRELGAAYRSELARGLSELGFGIERGTGRGGRYFELDGVPVRLLDRWSSRHHQVREAIEQRLSEKRAALCAIVAAGGPEARDAREQLRRLRRLSAGEDRYLTSSSRAAKDRLITHGDLDRHWSQTARSLGIDAAGVERLQESRRPVAVAGDRELLARLTEFDATFTDRDARAVALEASAGVGIEASLDALERLRVSGRLLALADGSHTTSAHRAIERETVSAAARLAGARLDPIPPGLVDREALALDRELKGRGGCLSEQQRQALELACADRQLVVIEGQAGTGKSTVLAAVARAHQADGRQIIVTSTGALAAQRLADDLANAGVTASSYSTIALHAALTRATVVLGPGVTVIHDEAALASTREQRRLLEAVERAGARLIEVGDPRQSKAVGAAGLWSNLEHTTNANRGMVELTRNVRAHDEADRRDQQLFRTGQHADALRGYEARGRVILVSDRRHAEDHALERAHLDRRAGKDTVVIAQTANERLDELNARAQAIRLQDNELGADSLPVPGRPYRLHPGDEVQIRRTISDPEHQQLRNGTTAQVISIDPHAGRLLLRISDGREIALDRPRIDRADIRLAYIQHPFPAQGRTTDTTHLILGEHTTQEGSYVALTRARESTHIYASQDQLDTDIEDADRDRVQALAERMSQTEPELPSIRTPLAHEHAIDADTNTPAITTRERTTGGIEPDAQPDHHLLSVLGQQPPDTDPRRGLWEQASQAIAGYRARYQITDPSALGAEPPAGEFAQRYDRRQTARQVLQALDELGRPVHHDGGLEERILNTPGLTTPQPQHERTIGWEP